MNNTKKWRKTKIICLLSIGFSFTQVTTFLIQANIQNEDPVEDTCSVEGISVENTPIRVVVGKYKIQDLIDSLVIRANGEVLSSECVKENLTIELTDRNDIPLTEDSITSAGPFPIKITLRDKSGTPLGFYDQSVYVNSSPSLVANNQEVNIEDGLDSKKIIESAWGSVVGYDEQLNFFYHFFEYNDSVPVGTPNKIVSQIAEGPSLQIDRQGLYLLKHTVTTINNEEVTSYSQVIVRPEVSVSDITGTLKINAKAFHIELNEVESLSENASFLLQKASAVAYENSSPIDSFGSGIDYRDITSSIMIDSYDLQEIKDSGDIGGVYPLTLYLHKDGKYVSKKISVTIGTGGVAPELVPTNDGNKLSISAHNFQIKHESVGELQEKDVIKKGNAKAVLVESGKELHDVSVNTAQLGAIQHAKTEGGVYDLTYQVTYQDKDDNQSSLQTTVQVEVVRKNSSSTKKASTQKASTSPQTSDSTNMQTTLLMLFFSTSILYVLSKKERQK